MYSQGVLRVSKRWEGASLGKGVIGSRVRLHSQKSLLSSLQELAAVTLSLVCIAFPVYCSAEVLAGLHGNYMSACPSPQQEREFQVA